MSNEPFDFDALHGEIVSQVEARIDAEPRLAAAAGPDIQPTAGAFPLGIRSLVPGLVKLALDSVISVASGMAEGFVVTNRDAIRSVVSEKVLEFVGRLVHGLEDAQPA